MLKMTGMIWSMPLKCSGNHLSLALYRAVEYRIPMVRVTNSGVGIFVQPTGEIVPGCRTPLFRKAAAAHRLYIPRSVRRTPAGATHFSTGSACSSSWDWDGAGSPEENLARGHEPVLIQ